MKWRWHDWANLNQFDSISKHLIIHINIALCCCNALMAKICPSCYCLVGPVKTAATAAAIIIVVVLADNKSMSKLLPCSTPAAAIIIIELKGIKSRGQKIAKKLCLFSLWTRWPPHSYPQHVPKKINKWKVIMYQKFEKIIYCSINWIGHWSAEKTDEKNRCIN